MRWAIFISGTGSNLSALLEERPLLDINLVLSSKPKAYGLLRAKRAGIPTSILPTSIQWNAVHEQLLQHRIEAIFLLGFMKVLPDEFIAHWKGKILNLHPSLLPFYPGLHSIERAWQEKQKLGATVHQVIAEVDQGEIILQRKVPIPVEKHYPLSQYELWVHIHEQKLIREAIKKWQLKNKKL